MRKSWRLAAVTAGAALSAAAGVAEAASYSNDFSAGLGGITTTMDLTPGADVEGGTLRMTQAVNSQQNSAYLPNLDPGLAISSFRAAFDYSITEGTCCGPTPPNGPADGFSFALSPQSSGTFGEEGPAQGLVVSFDTWDNGPPAEAPQIDLKVNNVVVATNATSPFTAGQTVPVVITLNPDGTLNMTLSGNPIFTAVPTGYTPAANDLFSFGARTGGANEVVRIDNLSVSTVPVPEPTTLGILGIGAVGLLARRRRRA